MSQQSHSWAHIRMYALFQRNMPPMFTAALFTVARTWK